MSPRHLSILIAAIAALGGAVMLAQPSGLLSQSIAQAPASPRLSEGANWLQDLNLTAEQLREIETIRGRYKNQLADKRQAMQQARQQLRNVMASDAPADQVRQQFTQVKSLKQQLVDTHFESMLAIREVLTPEQRQKFADRMQERGGKFRGRMRGM